jgi:2-dehydro-3-deoxy-D-arabinonate dehydratase
MHLSRHISNLGPRWALNGRYLPRGFTLEFMLNLPATALRSVLRTLPLGEEAADPLLAPVEDGHEVWAGGVTYLLSREARKAESELADVYERVYDAQRPELFLKSLGWRVSGDGAPIAVRSDSTWSVPEPELVLVVNANMELVGFTVGNDVSSRSIEGENPLYLPQAKIYNCSCSLGPVIYLPEDPLTDHAFEIAISISRNGDRIFESRTSTTEMKRGFGELIESLGRELDFPNGVFLMTGTGIVPGDDFSLCVGDEVSISIPPIGRLTNTVSALSRSERASLVGLIDNI